MKTMPGIALVFVSAIMLSSCGRDSSDSSDSTDVTRPDMAQAAKGNGAFSMALYGRLAEEAQGNNVFFSPFSLRTALARVYAGARGPTAEEMKKVLDYRLPQDKLHSAMGGLERAIASNQNCDINIANAVWGQTGYPFEAAYTDRILSDYKLPFRVTDFKAAPEDGRDEINDWIESRTRGNIKQMFAPGTINAQTRLVVANAVYFLGAWEKGFNRQATTDQPFTLVDGKTVKTPLMHQVEELNYGRGDGFKAIVLPYRGGDIGMLVMLPNEPDGIAELEMKLSIRLIADTFKAMAKDEVHVYLPRFAMATGFDAKSALSKMGMGSAFGPNADLTGIADPIRTGEQGLFINKALHRAFVIVNEEGTEAAAATGVAVEAKGAEAAPIVFRADHPFVFAILHRQTGIILFMGRMMGPAVAGPAARPAPAD